ncbi:hypothetical protein CEXT_169141, partial [Caerostris extrusa]
MSICCGQRSVQWSQGQEELD